MGVQSLGQEDHLEEGMATYSNFLAWRIPQTEDPGRLQSMGSQSRTQLSDLTLSLKLKGTHIPPLTTITINILVPVVSTFFCV